jgi:predicted PurR-regulated permease PerM
VVSSRAVAKIILVATAVFAALYFVYLIRTVIGALFIALFLAVALGPAVELLVRRKFPRALAIVTVYFGLFGAVVGLGLLVVPPIVNGVNDFVDNVPGYVDDLRKSKTFRDYDNKYDITPKLKEQAQNLPQKLGDAVSGLRNVTVGIFGALIQVVTILVMTFFILLDGKRMMRWAAREMGTQRAQRMERLAEDIYRAVGGYVAGNLLISLIAGLSSYLVMTLLNIPFAVPLAVLMAFLDLIPLVGSAIGGAIIGIAAAIVGFPTTLIIWAVFLIVYQQVENNVLQPVIYKRTVAIHPLLVIVAVLTGGSLLGILGALLAIPVAAALQIVVRDWYLIRKGRPVSPVPPVEPATA